ncbi:MAG: rRNA maturation RNase YbeY [Actinobacteria bacterium]|nr:rRNA maturation RNase YbeY [Actinomycetota bacterium]
MNEDVEAYDRQTYSFSDLQIIVSILKGQELGLDVGAFSAKVCTHLGIEKGEININFVSVDTMISVNRSYLGHDYLTDVITFNLGSEFLPNADVYISLDQAQSNADMYQQSLLDEVKLLVIHAFLHLLGHEDQSDQGRLRMRKREQDVLGALGE